MIEKIKININDVSLNQTIPNNPTNHNNVANYGTKDNNVKTEEIDLDTFNYNDNHTITEDKVSDAIAQNLANNHKLNEDINTQISNALKDRITNYLNNNGGSI